MRVCDGFLCSMSATYDGEVLKYEVVDLYNVAIPPPRDRD